MGITGIEWREFIHHFLTKELWLSLYWFPSYLAGIMFYSGKQPDAPGEDPAGQQPGGGFWERLHRHQWKLQPLWQVPGDEVHLWRNSGRSADIWVPAGEIQSHPPGSVNINSFFLCLFLCFYKWNQPHDTFFFFNYLHLTIEIEIMCLFSERTLPRRSFFSQLARDQCLMDSVSLPFTSTFPSETGSIRLRLALQSIRLFFLSCVWGAGRVKWRG